MKTFKVSILIALICLTVQDYADAAPDKQVKRVLLENAMENTALLKAMYQQINPDLIKPDRSVYQALVVHNQKTLIIYGKREQWIIFFTMDNANSSMFPLTIP